MKNINKKMAICMLVLSMYTPVSALSKTETVYSKLNYNGVVTDTIVNELLVNDKELEGLFYEQSNDIVISRLEKNKSLLYKDIALL